MSKGRTRRPAISSSITSAVDVAWFADTLTGTVLASGTYKMTYFAAVRAVRTGSCD